MILCGCRRVIVSPRDELVQFRWAATFENGKSLSLTFGESTAELTIRSDDGSLTLGGLCAVYDDHFVICDTDTEYLYSFDYTLSGNCVELSCDDGTLTLDKVKDTYN